MTNWYIRLAILNVVCREHSLNDKTTAQARVQMQIVTQLEVQLKKEKVRPLLLPVIMMVVSMVLMMVMVVVVMMMVVMMMRRRISTKGRWIAMNSFFPRNPGKVLIASHMCIEAILKHTKTSSWSPSKNTLSPVTCWFWSLHKIDPLETRCDWRRWWNTCIQMWVLAKKGKTGQSQRGEKVQNQKGGNFGQKRLFRADLQGKNIVLNDWMICPGTGPIRPPCTTFPRWLCPNCLRTPHSFRYLNTGWSGTLHAMNGWMRRHGKRQRAHMF